MHIWPVQQAREPCSEIKCARMEILMDVLNVVLPLLQRATKSNHSLTELVREQQVHNKLVRCHQPALGTFSVSGGGANCVAF